MKKTAMVIDDNADVLFAIQKALEYGGYAVRTSLSFDGIEAVVEEPPDVIFLDILLKEKNGCDIARALKADRRTNPIPIIMLSAFPHAKELAREAGADDCIEKPFNLDDLLAMAAEHTKSRGT